MTRTALAPLAAAAALLLAGGAQAKEPMGGTDICGANGWIPAGAAVRWDYGDQGVAWADVDAATNKRLRQLVAGIEPYALPVPSRVTIGDREVRAPQTYLRLFRGRKVYTWPATAWLQIRVEAASPSPWTDGRSTFMLARNKPYVIVDHWVYRIPKTVSAQAHRGVALRG